jgi:hypothetical protein
MMGVPPARAKPRARGRVGAAGARKTLGAQLGSVSPHPPSRTVHVRVRTGPDTTESARYRKSAPDTVTRRPTTRNGEASAPTETGRTSTSAPPATPGVTDTASTG